MPIAIPFIENKPSVHGRYLHGNVKKCTIYAKISQDFYSLIFADQLFHIMYYPDLKKFLRIKFCVLQVYHEFYSPQNMYKIIIIHVIVYSDQPNVLYQPANSTVVQNSTVTIPCGINVADAVVEEYSWQLNNSQLSLPSPQYILDAGNITISNVQAEDGGIYECLATLSVPDNMADDLLFIVGRGMISVVCKSTVVTFLNR